VLLAICRKVIILDLKETDASQMFARAAAILEARTRAARAALRLTIDRLKAARKKEIK